MAKRYILNSPGLVHFVTFSTYQRRRFLEPDRTRSIVTEVLRERLHAREAQCHGFVVMPDHVHALLTVADDKTISEFMLSWKKTSSYRIRQFYTQELTRYAELCPGGCAIWQARYYDHHLEKIEHINGKLDYVHNNPVQARLVESDSDWAWSSAAFYERQAYVGVPISVAF